MMLTVSRVSALLAPYVAGLAPDVLESIVTYVELVLRWNARTNLTAVRDPEALVQRQVGESLFASELIPPDSSVLDFGSGAGFPGIPLLLLLPGLCVTLAESQGKKAAFLREAVRSLGITAEVWSGRVEAMEPSRLFDTVVMRAVDHTASMLPIAQARVAAAGQLVRYLADAEPTEMEGWTLVASKPVPLSGGTIAVWRRATE